MFCHKCGKEIPDDSEFCQYCGTAFSIKKEPEVRQEPEKNQMVVEKPAKKLPKSAIIIGIAALLMVAALIGYIVGVPASRLKKAQSLIDDGEWESAISYIEAIDDEKCKSLLPLCYYNLGKEYLDSGDYSRATEALKKTDYSDASKLYEDSLFLQGKQFFDAGEWIKAIDVLENVDSSQAKNLYNDAVYQYAKSFYEAANWAKTIEVLQDSDSIEAKELLSQTHYNFGKEYYAKEDYQSAAKEFELSDYSDARALYEECQKQINSDFAFQKEFETIYINDAKDFVLLCKNHLSLIEKYENQPFYSEDLVSIIQKYKKAISFCLNNEHDIYEKMSVKNAAEILSFYQSKLTAYNCLKELMDNHSFFVSDDEVYEGIESSIKTVSSYITIIQELKTKFEGKPDTVFETWGFSYYFSTDIQGSYDVDITFTVDYKINGKEKTKKDTYERTISNPAGKYQGIFWFITGGTPTKLNISNITWKIYNIKLK